MDITRPVSRILCAPDSFKGSMTAAEAARAMAAGIAEADPTIHIDQCPIADGGEGTLDTLIHATSGEIHTARVTGPLGETLEARWGMLGGGTSRRGDGGGGSSGSRGPVAIVEMAEASGLVLIPEDQRDPTQTTTFGTGELMRIAADKGCTAIIVAIGGSGTNDGGAGMAQALGVRFLDDRGNPITEPMTGGRLHTIARIEGAADLPPVRVACDVSNPLCGPHGASATYGPQKGATPEQIKLLDGGLAHLAFLVSTDPDTPGAGAAGGIGFGLTAFAAGVLEPGIELVLDAVNFDERCRAADLVLTGEGCLDRQSLHGKATIGVARAAKRLGVPTIALVGATGAGYEECLEGGGAAGVLSACESLAERFGFDEALANPVACLRELTKSQLR